MTKPRPKKMYAVVKANRPNFSHLELYPDTDIKLEKDEQLWEIEIRPTKQIKKRT